jgi:hypothetical protein
MIGFVILMIVLYLGLVCGVGYMLRQISRQYPPMPPTPEPQSETVQIIEAMGAAFGRALYPPPPPQEMMLPDADAQDVPDKEDFYDPWMELNRELAKRPSDLGQHGEQMEG